MVPPVSKRKVVASIFTTPLPTVGLLPVHSLPLRTPLLEIRILSYLTKLVETYPLGAEHTSPAPEQVLIDTPLIYEPPVPEIYKPTRCLNRNGEFAA